MKNVPIQATRDEKKKKKKKKTKGVEIEYINKAACDEGMHTLRQSAEKLVLEGVTSFQEMLKTTFEN